MVDQISREFPPPDDPRLQRIHVATLRLTEILSEEIELLKSRRPQELENFREEKSKLIGLYLRELATLKSVVQTANPPSPLDLKNIRHLTATFNDTLQRHELILTAKRKATEGMLSAIGQEVARRNKPVESYQKTGVLGPAMPTFAAARPTTLTLDQRI